GNACECFLWRVWGGGTLIIHFYFFICVFIGGNNFAGAGGFWGEEGGAGGGEGRPGVGVGGVFFLKRFTGGGGHFFVPYHERDWAVKPANWLNNPGYHGFSEMLYQYTSTNANNGSGFEGLSDNNPFWNITGGIAMILGRFLPIIGPVAIAGLLAEKKYIPESQG